jgi:hypothetical protein
MLLLVILGSIQVRIFFEWRAKDSARSRCRSDVHDALAEDESVLTPARIRSSVRTLKIHLVTKVGYHKVIATQLFFRLSPVLAPLMAYPIADPSGEEIKIFFYESDRTLPWPSHLGQMPTNACRSGCRYHIAAENAPTMIAASDVELATFHLSRYVRSEAEKTE